MTVRQIIQQIEELPPREFDELAAYFQNQGDKDGRGAPQVTFLDPALARPMIKEILTEHAELFRKLAE